MRFSWAKCLLLGVLALPIAEIVVFVAVAAQIGFVNAFLIQLVCSLAGIMVIRSAGRVRLERRRSQFGEGMIRTARLDGADLARLVAGVLLVVPGFLIDALGALLLVPLGRRRRGALLRRATGSGVDLEPGEWERQESGIRSRASGRNLKARLPDV